MKAAEIHNKVHRHQPCQVIATLAIYTSTMFHLFHPVDLYKGPMRQWNQDALISLQEDLTVNVNVNDSGMINHLTKLPTISSEKPSIGILSRRETMVVEKTKEMDQMSKIIGMLLGKEDDAFQNFCMILEICGAGVWSGRLKERARAFKKANGIHVLA